MQREDKKPARAEHVVEQQFNTEVRVRDNHKVEMKSHPRIDIRIEHQTGNQSTKVDEKVLDSSAVSFDSESERQYQQVNGSFKGNGGISVNCEVQGSPSHRRTSINIAPCSEQKGIYIELNGSESPCSSYEADADYEVISNYNSNDTKLTGPESRNIAAEQETKAAEQRPSLPQEGALHQENGNGSEGFKLPHKEDFKNGCLKDMREAGATHPQNGMSSLSPEVPRSPQCHSPPLSPHATSNARKSLSEDADRQEDSNMDSLHGCKPGVVASEPADVPSKTDVQANKTSKPLELPVTTKGAAVHETSTKDTSPQDSECENSTRNVLPSQNAEHGTEKHPPVHEPLASDAPKAARPECPARKKHDLQKSDKGDSSKDSKLLPPRTAKPSPQRNANAKQRDTRIYQKVGVKVLPTKAEANSDVKLSLPMEHRISRPLSPPPPIPATTSPRRVPVAGPCVYGVGLYTYLSVYSHGLPLDNSEELKRNQRNGFGPPNRVLWSLQCITGRPACERHEVGSEKRQEKSVATSGRALAKVRGVQYAPFNRSSSSSSGGGRKEQRPASRLQCQFLCRGNYVARSENTAASSTPSPSRAYHGLDVATTAYTGLPLFYVGSAPGPA
ncbi:hypothetical protein HPB50_015719 [Hyalomma asiaticum]|uniref:Uncharacterized protein n=1 Tax=Hyalomma asiaticum TaxID=266040 RepID=A0ACB7SV43_HYAAI|nr:hypothetical protein HPB50_015719 [Hyalomma asiaticum]